jgi:NTP pyrophosphatase (non-canonical NTP hydrolase)
MSIDKEFNDTTLTSKHLTVYGRFGGEIQADKTIEELQELIIVLKGRSELCKADYRKLLLEEGADVLNMLSQMFIMACIDWDDVVDMMNQKMDRTIERYCQEVKNFKGEEMQ